MDSASRFENELLRRFYLTGVRPNGNDIGVGSYGRVFEVEYCGTVYAAKEVHSILVQGVTPEEFEATKKAFLSECIQSGALSHPNVVQFLGVYNPGGQSRLPVLVMERMEESLTSVVGKYPNIPMCVKLSMLVDVSRGLWYLHSHNPPIVHRDLSPNNVLLTSQFVVKISDLGVAKVIEADSKKTKTRAPGTVDFMGPEALLETPEYGPPLDVFSYGGVILHVVNQEWPKPLHYVVTDPKTRRRIALSEVERRQEHVEKMRGAPWPADVRVLVEQCLDDDPARRPPISDVSERMRRMKETDGGWSPDVAMNPITWQVEQVTEKLEQLATSPEVKAQQPVGIHDIFSKPVEVKWDKLAPLLVGRISCTVVLLHGSVYVGGGFEGRSVNDDQVSYRLDVYNLSTNQWSPSPIITPYYAYAMTVLDDKLITVGGLVTDDEATDKVLVLDAGQWKDYSEMPFAKSCATAVGYHSMLMVIGGKAKVKGKWTVISAVELLDTTDGCWYTCNNLPAPHFQLQASVVNNILYLLGGFNAQGQTSLQVFSSSLETLSTHQLKWQSVTDTPWHFSSPVVLSRKFLLVVGGSPLSDPTIQSSGVQALNPSTGLWELITNIPVPTRGPTVVGVADNKLIVLGGTIGSKQRLYSTNMWIGTFK